MSYANAPGGSRRATAIAAAVLVHVVLLYALITGSALRVVEVMREPFMTRIIAEPKPAAAPAEKPAAPTPPKPVSVPRVKPKPAPVPHPKPRPAPVPQVPAPEVVSPSAPPAERAITATPAELPASEPTPGPSDSATADGLEASVQLEGCVMPEYPAASIAAEETGTVALSFLVGADGRVLESRVDRSSGHRRLDEAARRALGRCKFRPAIADGKPHQAWAHINYVWRLE
jgi:periplasmic protein TonB